jgi:hypothetical protein
VLQTRPRDRFVIFNGAKVASRGKSYLPYFSAGPANRLSRRSRNLEALAQLEIDLAAERVDARHFDANVIA